MKHHPGDPYGQQEGPQEVDQGRVQDGTPEKPQVKVKPGQGAGAKGLLITEAPAPFIQLSEDGGVTGME